MFKFNKNLLLMLLAVSMVGGVMPVMGMEDSNGSALKKVAEKYGYNKGFAHGTMASTAVFGTGLLAAAYVTSDSGMTDTKLAVCGAFTLGASYWALVRRYNEAENRRAENFMEHDTQHNQGTSSAGSRNTLTSSNPLTRPGDGKRADLLTDVNKCFLGLGAFMFGIPLLKAIVRGQFGS